MSNVPAIVMFEQQAPLLLGQSAIQQLGTVSMNGNRLVIHKIDNNSLSDDEIDALFADAKKYCDNKMWASALECYEKLYNANVLNSWGKDSYSYLLHKNREYGKALDVIISIDDYTPFIERNYNIYRTLGNRFYFAERYKEALPYYKSDSFRQCTKYIDSTTGDIFWAFIGYERCNYVIGKTSENGSPLYYALLRNSNGSKFLFFTDQEGYETLIGQITRIENTYILDVATRRTDVSTIRNTLAPYGLYFPDITIQ